MGQSAWDQAGKVKTRHTRRRRLLGVLGVLLLLLALLVVFAPAIASPFVASLIADKGSDAISGRVEVRSVSLSWFGPQRVTGLRIRDDANQNLAEVDVKADVGLLGLALGSRDLGTIAVSGNASVRRNDQGRINVVEATRPANTTPPSATPKSSGSGIPPSFRATLNLDGLTVNYSDPFLDSRGVKFLSLRSLRGTGTFATGAPLTVDFTGSVADTDGPATSGTLRVQATLTGLIDSAGAISTDAATIKTTVSVDKLSPALLDRLTDAPIDVARASGSTMNITLDAEGPLLRPSVRLDARSANVLAGGAVGFDGPSLVVREPIHVTLSEAALAAVDPEWLARVTAGSLDVRSMPGVTLAITRLRVPIGGASLASSSVAASIDLGALDAVVSVGEGESAVARKITTEPASFSIDSTTLAEGLAAKGSLRFKVNDKDGGTLTLDAVASDLLEQSGALRTDQLPRLRGLFALEGADTAVIQPFVAAADINMGTEVGPTLSLGVELTPESDSTAVHALVASDNVNGEAYLTLGGTRLLTDELPTQIRVGTLGPLLTRKLTDAGVRVRQGASLTITVHQLDADLAGPLSGGAISPLDLTASCEVAVGPTSGVFTADGQVRQFDIEQVAAMVQFTGPARSAQVRMATGGALDNRPAGSATAEFRFDELVAPDGSWSFGVPASIRGRAEIVNVATTLIEPYLKIEGATPGQLIGPTVDLVIEAAPSGEHVTRIALTLTSEQVTADGAFLLRPDALALDAAGFTLTHASLAPVLAGMVDLGPGASIRGVGGPTELSLSRLNIPLDPDTRAPRLDRLDIAGRLVVRQVHLDRPGIADPDQLELRQIVLNARQSPGAAAVLDTNAVFYNLRQQFRVEGHFEAPGLRDALAGTRSFDIAGLEPAGSLTAPELPASLLAEAVRLASLTGVDVDALASDIAGESFSLQLAVKTVSDRLEATLAARGQRLTVDAGATLSGSLESATLSSEIKLSRPSSEQLLRAFLPDMADSVGVVGTTAFRIDASLSQTRAVEARLRVPVMTISGLESQPLRLAIDSTAKTSLPADPASARPFDVTLLTSVAGSDRDPVARVNGTLSGTLGGADTSPMTGRVEATGLRTVWADKLLGSDDLYQGLIGSTLGVVADAAVDPATGSTKVSADIAAPNLKSASKFALTLRSGAVLLDQPYSATWTGDSAWLSRRLASSLEDRAPAVDSPIRVEIDLRRLSLPPTGERAPGVNLDLDLVARVPQADLTMPGGEKRAYRTLVFTARTSDAGTGVDAALGGDLRLGDGNARRAIDLTIGLRRLVTAGVLTPADAFINADGRLEHIPTSLVDAFAGTGGLLSDMLGPDVAVEDIKLRRAPLEGGTVSFTARSANAAASIAGTFKDDKEDGTLVDGAFVVDQGSYVELSAFQTSFTKKLLDTVPIFGSIKRAPDSDRPTRITVQSMSLPMSGKIDAVDFNLLADLGTVEYGLSGPLEGALKLTGQKSLGQVGARIQPFDISMARGIVRYDRLTVPLGEFNFDSNGSINLISKTKDLLILMPAGRFAVEAFGIQGLLGDFVNNSVKIPMNNAGALDARDWKPDFSKAQGELFKPEKILDEAVKKGIGNLLNRGRGGGTGGGG